MKFKFQHPQIKSYWNIATFVYCLWLFSCYNSRAVVTETIWPPNLKHLPCKPLQEKKWRCLTLRICFQWLQKSRNWDLLLIPVCLLHLSIWSGLAAHRGSFFRFLERSLIQQNPINTLTLLKVYFLLLYSEVVPVCCIYRYPQSRTQLHKQIMHSLSVLNVVYIRL